MPQPFGHAIKQRTFIAVPPDKVYIAITSADEWDAFFTTGMEIDPRPGGVMIWRWKNWGPDFYTTEVPGRVLETEPPRKFVFQWGSRRPTTISVTLEPVAGGTVVTLTEDGYDDTADDRKMILECACGWGEALTLLKFYLEHGITYLSSAK